MNDMDNTRFERTNILLRAVKNISELILMALGQEPEKLKQATAEGV